MNLIEAKDAERFALSFFRSRDPKVLLLMPGCEPIGTNEAYQTHFGPAGDLSVARSLSGYVDALGRARKRAAKRKSAEGFEGWRCVCEELKAIDALLRTHCVFESLCDEAEQSTETEWHPGLEFVRSRNFERNSTRHYQTYRVHARLVPCEGITLLDARLLPLGLETTVATKSREGLRPEVLDVRVRINGTSWLEFPDCRPAQTTYSRDYERFDRHLEETLSMCRAGNEGAAKQHLRDFLRFEGVSYPQVIIISNLLQEPNVGALAESLSELRQRLWDAPVIVERVRPQLDEKLGELSELEKLTAELPFAVGRKLLRGATSIGELEAEDAYTGMIEILPNKSSG